MLEGAIIPDRAQDRKCWRGLSSQTEHRTGNVGGGYHHRPRNLPGNVGGGYHHRPRNLPGNVGGGYHHRPRNLPGNVGEGYHHRPRNLPGNVGGGYHHRPRNLPKCQRRRTGKRHGNKPSHISQVSSYSRPCCTLTPSAPSSIPNARIGAYYCGFVKN